jgi:hypothetical protein
MQMLLALMMLVLQLLALLLALLQPGTWSVVILRSAVISQATVASSCLRLRSC